MPEAAPPSTAPAGDPQALCASSALEERGPALVFDVLEYGRPQRAFVMRFDGRVVAYLNRCAHVPVEMDWQPGHFLDAERAFIVCSIHGAVYDPAQGRCAGGPCNGKRLQALRVDEADGQVSWYPSPNIRPVFDR